MRIAVDGNWDGSTEGALVIAVNAKKHVRIDSHCV